MPLHSSADYIPVMDQFIAHWTQLDNAVVPFIPQDGLPVTLADFEALRTLLDDRKTLLQSRLNTLEASRVALQQIREEVGDRIAEFNRRLRADFPNNRSFGKLPNVPNRTAGRDAFLDAMDDMLDLWNTANTQPVTPIYTGTLLLRGGLTRAQFLARRTALDGAFTARGTAENALDAVRINRNQLQDRVNALMVQYRLTVESRFAPEAAEVLTLPRVTPASGHTPQPVTLTAAWQPAENNVLLAWTQSQDPDLQDYQLRSCPGPDYNADLETMVETFLPTDPRVFETDQGFDQPGAIVSYRQYVRLNTGNQAGSEARTVTRPG